MLRTIKLKSFFSYYYFSLNDDTYQTVLTMSDNENNHMDSLIGMKKKRRYKHNHSSTTIDKRQRRCRYREGNE